MLVRLEDACKVMTLGPPFDMGGEAEVRPIVGDDWHVAKVFFKPSSDRREERCRAWIASPPHDVPTRDGTVRYAVPLEILLDPDTGAFLGFTMWRVRNDPVKGGLLWNPAGSRFQPFRVARSSPDASPGCSQTSRRTP